MPKLENLERLKPISLYNKIAIHRLSKTNSLLDIFILEREENGCINYDIFKNFCDQCKIPMNLEYTEVSALAYGYDANTLLLEVYYEDDDGGIYNG